MNIRKLQRGLKYRGRVKAPRQTYHVFEAADDFFVLSFALSKSRRGSGYFNAVTMDSVRYVKKRFAGRSGVTARQVVTLARRTRHAPTTLAALNILYVLVALAQASILRAGAHRQLFFALRRGQVLAPAQIPLRRPAK